MAVKNSIPLTQERLRELLHYDAETGAFTRRIPSHKGRWKAGDTAGCLCKKRGYVLVRVWPELYLAHRLAWLYIHGGWPKADIDHINGNRSDNRLSNLREATRAENNQNRHKASTSNKSTGLIGAYGHSNHRKFTSAIYANGKQIGLGSYATAAEAHAAYIEAKRRIHPFGML